MKQHLVAAALTFAGLAAALPAGAISLGVPTRAYALGNNGATLVSLGDLSNPATRSGTAITDTSGASLRLSAIAYRPKTMQYYGYSDQKNAFYQVDPMTGIATFVASSNPVGGTAVATTGLDFNNVLDAARLVSTADDNLVVFPNNVPANVVRATTLFYNATDVNAGIDPNIFANAYTNAIPMPTTTAQFVLDSGTDSLVTLGNNAGNLGTVGKIAIGTKLLDFSEVGGMDILSLSEGNNTAFALLNTASGAALYSLALMADANGYVQATKLSDLGASYGVLTGLAVAAVPLPAGALLLGTALAGLMVARCRSRPA